MYMWELSTETNWIETAVVRYGVAAIFATVNLREKFLFDHHTTRCWSKIIPPARFSAAYLKSGEAVDYWKRISRVYAKRQHAMLEALSRYFPKEAQWREVDGGPQLWVRIPDDVSVRQLCNDALKTGVSFVPGEAFFPEPDNQNYIRLNFAAVEEKRFEIGIRALGRLIRSEAHSSVA